MSQIAVQYIRVSSEEQSKGGSLGAQEREGQDYIKKTKLDCLAVFQDVETAKSAGREEFGKMLDFIKRQKKPVVLVVEKTDRLYRNIEDHVAISGLTVSKGLQVHLYKENEVLDKSTSSHKKLMHRFKLIMAQNYVENLSEEIKKGREQKLLSGDWPHKAPYGYINNKNTKKIEIHDAQAPFVQHAFELYATGLYSYSRLAEKLFDDGYPYKLGFPKITKGGLEKMLKNPFYMGEMEVSGQLYQGNHEPLISKKTWLAAQQQMRKTAKSLQYGTIDFKYGNLLRCFHCDATMVGENKKGGRYVYYRCSRQKYGCEQGYVNEVEIDKSFERLIQFLVIPEDWEKEVIEAAESLGGAIEDRTSQELKKVDAEIQQLQTNYKKALMEKIKGHIDDDIWEEFHQDYQKSKRVLAAKRETILVADISYLESAKQWVELPKILVRRWPVATTEQKLTLLNFIGSNYKIEAKKLHYKLEEPFSSLEKTALRQTWWRKRDDFRTFFVLQSRNIMAAHKALTA